MQQYVDIVALYMCMGARITIHPYIYQASISVIMWLGYTYMNHELICVERQYLMISFSIIIDSLFYSLIPRESLIHNDLSVKDMALDTVKPELIQETLEDAIVPLNREHEIVQKYLESRSWDKTDFSRTQGKRAVMKVLEYHYTYCSLLENHAHKIVKEYLESGNWKKADILREEGRRYLLKVLDYHYTYCLHIIEPNKKVIQKVLWECAACGKQMMLTPIQAKQKTYCSFECFKSVARKRKPPSEKRKFRMSPEWRQTRKKRISDFGHTCPMTSETEELDVHHIDSDYSNNEPENLIPLQRELHRLVTARANYDDFLEARDRAVFTSITQAWKQ